MDAGLASLVRGLGVRFFVSSAAAAATTAPAASQLLYLLQAVADGLEGGQDGVLVGRGGELVRCVGGCLVGFGRDLRATVVGGAVVHRCLEGSGEVRHLGVHPLVDVLVGHRDVRRAVIPCGRGASRHHLVETEHLDVALAEEHNEIIEAVVRRACSPLHHLILKILVLLYFQQPHHHQLRLAGGESRQ